MKRLFFARLISFTAVLFLAAVGRTAAVPPQTVIQRMHSGRVTAVDFHPSGQYIASAGGGTVKIWTLAGELIRTFGSGSSEAYKVQFSPCGDYIAFDSGGVDVKLYTITGKLIRSIDGHGGFTFTSKGEKLVTWGGAMPWGIDAKNKRPGVSLWTAGGAAVRIIGTEQHIVKSVTTAPDGKSFAADTGKNTVRIVSFNGDLLQTFEAPGGTPVCFSPDGRMIAIVETVFLSSTVTLRTAEGALISSFKRQSQLVFSPDGNRIALFNLGLGNEIDLRTADRKPLRRLTHNGWEITAASFTSDGRYLVSSAKDGTIQFWGPEGKPVRTFSHDFEVTAFALSQDNRYVAGGGPDGSGGGHLNVWSTDGFLLASLNTKRKRIGEVSFSPDGKYIASGVWRNGADLWSGTGALLWRKSGPGLQSDSPTSVCFSSDGRSLESYYAGAFTDSIEYWTVPEGQHFKDSFTPAEKNRLFDFVYSPDAVEPSVSGPEGRRSATVYVDGPDWILTIRDDTGKSITSFQINHTPQGMLTPWLSLAFSPDWQYLVNGTWDNKIQLWTLEGEMVRTFTGHTAGIYSIDFSPEGNYLVSGSLDGTMRVWNVRTGGWIELTAFSSDEWIALHPSGQFFCSPGAKKYIRFVEGLSFLSGEKYWDQFYTPDLLQKFMGLR